MEGLPDIWGNEQMFSPYTRRSLVIILIYDFAPDPSEFPKIWWKFSFLFYQCGQRGERKGGACIGWLLQCTKEPRGNSAMHQSPIDLRSFNNKQTTQHPSLLSDLLDALMDSKWTTDLSWVSLSIAQYFYAFENISCCCWKLTAKAEYDLSSPLHLRSIIEGTRNMGKMGFRSRKYRNFATF